MICGGVIRIASIVLSFHIVAPQTSICRPRNCYDLQCYNLTQSTKATVWLQDRSGLSPLEVRWDLPVGRPTLFHYFSRTSICVMIELRHMDIRHFVIEESRLLANGRTTMWFNRVDVTSLSIIYGRNNMRCQYYRICIIIINIIKNPQA